MIPASLSTALLVRGSFDRLCRQMSVLSARGGELGHLPDETAELVETYRLTIRGPDDQCVGGVVFWEVPLFDEIAMPEVRL